MGSINISRTVAGITKCFWFTFKGYISYLMLKFKDLVPTTLGSGSKIENIDEKTI